MATLGYFVRMKTKMTDKASLKKVGGYRVKLANRGNPDRGQDPSRPVYGTTADRWVPAKTMKEARNIFLNYIQYYNLGGANVTGGELEASTNSGFNPVGKFSFNGRLWSPEGSEILI